MKLKDKRAFLTGADSGIGQAIAETFAQEGADVAIVYYTEHAMGRRVGRSADHPRCAAGSGRQHHHHGSPRSEFQERAMNARASDPTTPPIPDQPTIPDAPSPGTPGDVPDVGTPEPEPDQQSGGTGN